MNQVTAQLIEAYNQTNYQVFDLNLTLKVNSVNLVFDTYLKANGKTTWAFITAHNPHSKLLTVSQNKYRHQQLIHHIATYSLEYMEGEGQSIMGDWPAERSLLLFDIDKKLAQKIGRRFSQNAILYGKIGEKAKFLWL